MKFQTDIRLSRSRQINTLRVFHDNVTEVVPNKEYSVSFNSSGHSLILVIKLPDNFPNQKPLVEISPAVLHPWVDSSGRIDSPGLRNFSQHSDLGMVIGAIKQELKKSSLQLQNPGARSQGVAALSPSYCVLPPSAGSAVNTSPDPLSAKLADLPVEELKGILNDEDHFEKFIMEAETDYEPLSSLLESINSMREELEKKALENQDLQTQIESSRNEIICKYQEFHQKKSELQSTIDRLRELEARVEPNLLADRLVRLSVASEEESDDIAESFLQQNIDVDQFITKYIKVRGDGYMKKVKADKVKQIK
ncbi:vacuolar protein sorting-associated protein 37A [Eurytemora carolleeae]|uniref:vacuolar protein sorting-associated protein 37A n=1 Tax=Eurytemora carolleeae TaxID=1294199 RepID=UPI000C769263|nr:vacuolar protein sorting-associated protein 37A [Eurytemora carolleeae]|eukprot:XP_023328389.1 vacuolar protein sorting-associated protein 37A-like [Eurytemora affinis]